MISYYWEQILNLKKGESRMEQLIAAIPTILLVLIEVIVVLAGCYGLSLLKKVMAKAGIELDDKVMGEINSVLELAVDAVNQKFTDKYKDASVDGKLTEAQKAELFEKTKNIVMSGLSSEQMETLMKRFGMTGEEAVELLIEQTVRWNR